MKKVTFTLMKILVTLGVLVIAVGCSGSSSSAVSRYEGIYSVTEYQSGAFYAEGDLSISSTGSAEYNVSLPNSLDRLVYLGIVAEGGSLTLTLASGPSTQEKMSGTLVFKNDRYVVEDGQYTDAGGVAIPPGVMRWSAFCINC